MFRNITIGQFIPGESFIHRLDPRTKILAALVLIVLLFLLRTAVGYLAVAVFVFLLIAVSRIPLYFVLRGLRPLFVIIILTFSLHLFLTEGETLVRIGFLRITEEGLVRGALMSSRLVLLVLGTSLLTLSTSPIHLTDGIESLLKPGTRIGVPAHELAMMMTIALRFIPTLMEETEKIMKAQMARGADFESGNIMRRARNFIPLLVPLFISAFRRADDLAVAMEARAYRGGEGRTKFRELQFSRADGASLGVVVFIAVVLGLWF